MTITRFSIPAFAALFAAAFALPACADNDNAVRVGVDYISNHSRSSEVTSNGPDFLTPQPAGASAGNATTLVLGYTRKLSPHWDVELVVGSPPKVDAKGTGTLAPFGTIAHIKEAGPNLFAIYNFGAPGDLWRPFVGLGVNYTRFFDAETTPAGDLALGGPTHVSLSNSIGPAGKAGVTFRIDDRWSIVAAIAAMKVKSDMTTMTGSIERKATIDFRPVVYTAGVSYRF